MKPGEVVAAVMKMISHSDLTGACVLALREEAEKYEFSPAYTLPSLS